MANRLIPGIILIFFCIGFSLFAQETVSNVSADITADAVDASRNIMLARSSADYLVTPGDVYTLSYAAGGTPVTFIISVDPSYRIRVSNLGVVNGLGKTFMQVKEEVETIVSRNFPLSGVQLVLTQPAIFRVLVNGEVHSAGEVPVWGLNRLSSLRGSLTSSASIRDVTVRSSNGQVRVYDLFKAQRLGDMSQDPYLRPGDVVTFNRVERRVTINEQVQRPGTYQLLPNENLKELIEIYGDGLTPLADLSRMELERLVNSDDVTGNLMFLSERCFEENIALEHFDIITIPSILQMRSVIFVEGAVRAIGEIDSSETLPSSNRIVVRFIVGETYASLARRNIEWFTEMSDISNAYVLRNDEYIPINLNLALYDVTYRGQIFVEENDILVVPFRQSFVSVSGAVRNPGRYPFIPDRDWEYYIGLAGGFVAGQNSRDSITIFDMNGNRLRKSDKITPETTITANTNHFLFFFSQYGPVLSTFLSVFGTVLSILAITGNI